MEKQTGKEDTGINQEADTQTETQTATDQAVLSDREHMKDYAVTKPARERLERQRTRWTDT